jgi:hypothetical protein
MDAIFKRLEGEFLSNERDHLLTDDNSSLLDPDSMDFYFSENLNFQADLHIL